MLLSPVFPSGLLYSEDKKKRCPKEAVRILYIFYSYFSPITIYLWLTYLTARACLKKAFCKMCVTICGRFRSDEGAVAGYGNRIPVKSPAKWGVQIAGMIFQTHSSK
ncbi:DUF6783 domain-containing protein [Ruminococcus sp. Marseille-P328]|uniref:DUF6783 domain-containing protein n=1 Tax=unclassified Ruminococcus TaxID=2608920 RepID=UPI0035614613